MRKVKSKLEKRSQRDYTLGFKLSVISLVERGEMTYKQAQNHYGIQARSTVLVWLRKHGSLDWSNPKSLFMSPIPKKETPAQKIKRLERQLQDEKNKNELLNTMIDISDKQFGTSIRKKYSSHQSENSNKIKK